MNLCEFLNGDFAEDRTPQGETGVIALENVDQFSLERDESQKTGQA